MVKLTESEVEDAMFGSESIGYCTECGELHYGIEPDAHGYKCEKCGAMAVAGVEELLLMGQIEIIPE